jgi:polar amino acid transport system substrate-binding protein
MTRIIAGALLLIGLTLGAVVRAEACDTTLRWAWNAYEPYSYRDEIGDLVGLDVDLTRAILDLAGCTYRTDEIPAKRALKMLENGEVDMVAAASVTPERQAYGYFSKPYRSERVVMFVRRDDPVARSIDRFADVLAVHLRVAAGSSGSYGPAYDAARPGLEAAGLLTLNASLEQRLQQLARHRVDVVVEDEVAAASTARKLGLTASLQEAGAPLSEEPVRLLFSRKSVSADLVAVVNQAIDRLTASPAYAQILAKRGILEP